MMHRHYRRRSSLVRRILLPSRNKAVLALVWLAYLAVAYYGVLAARDVAFYSAATLVQPTAKLPALRTYNANRYRIFYDPSRIERPWSQVADVAAHVPAALTTNLHEPTRLLRDMRDLRAPPPPTECATMTQMQQLSVPACRAAWSYALETEEIVGIETLNWFTKDKLASFVVVLADGRRAMYKPCAGRFEYPECEVISYYMDMALGMNRVAPIVLRNVTVDSMRQLIRRKPTNLFESLSTRLLTMDVLERTCAEDGVMYGAMIGWWQGAHGSRTLPKRKSDGVAKVEGMPLSVLLEETENHVFCYLLQLLREPGKNEFRLADGQLVMIDLDRAQFYLYRKAASYKLSICSICSFHRHLYETLRDLADAPGSFSALLQAYLHAGPSRPLELSDSKVRVIDSRIRSIVACMEDCIAEYGEDRVLH